MTNGTVHPDIFKDTNNIPTLIDIETYPPTGAIMKCSDLVELTLAEGKITPYLNT
jgi:hypothetical protein